jgi:hypothetical protein
MNTDCAVEPGKSGGGPPQSKTWRKFGEARRARSVLECASPLALWDGTMANTNAFRMPQGQRVAPARRTKLGEVGNQMMADGNSFPVFILGWTIGAIGV